MEQTKYDVFISYSSKDQKIAEGVCAYLEQKKIRCFVAYRDIPKGKVWAKAIVEALDVSQMMVVVFSKNFNVSDQVDREIELAAEDHKPILTFRLSDDDFQGAKKYYLKNLNWIDAFPNPHACFGKLSEGVMRLLGRPVEVVNDKKEPVREAGPNLKAEGDRADSGQPRQRPVAAPAPKASKFTPDWRNWIKGLYIGISIGIVAFLAIVLWPKQTEEDTMPIKIVAESAPSATAPAPIDASPAAVKGDTLALTLIEASPVAVKGGTLTLTSIPSGAAVKVDGKYKGDTPLTLEEQPPGKHTIVFSLEGYESTEKTVTVSEGKIAQLNAVMQRWAK